MAPEFTVTALRMVREVAGHGSFSAAADALGYTQSAVSRQIALAEAVAGRPLFQRLPRGVRLTEAGELVLRHADAVLAELDAVRQELDDLVVQPPRRIRVGAFSTSLAALVPRAIATLAEDRPQTRVVLREGTSETQLGRLEAGRLDVAVVNAPARRREGVQVLPLLDDPLLLAVGPGNRLAGRAAVDADELAGERWVAATLDPGGALLGAWTDSSWQPDIAFLAKDWGAKLGLVAAGLAATVVPGIAATAVPDGVVLVPIDHPAATRATAIAIAGDGSAAADVKAFVDALEDVAREQAAGLQRRLRRHQSRRSPVT